MKDGKFTGNEEVTAKTETTEENDPLMELIVEGGKELIKTYAEYGKCDEDKMALFREASMLFDDFCKAIDDDVFEIRKPEIDKMGAGRLRVVVEGLDINFEPLKLFKELVEMSDAFCVTQLTNGYVRVVFAFYDLIVVDWDNLY